MSALAMSTPASATTTTTSSPATSIASSHESFFNSFSKLSHSAPVVFPLRRLCLGPAIHQQTHAQLPAQPQAQVAAAAIAPAMPVPIAPIHLNLFDHEDDMHSEGEEEDEDYDSDAGTECVSQPIPIPNVGMRDPAPLPIGDLRYLDAHVWNTQKCVLRNWAAGIRFDVHSQSDVIIEPCSPPRRQDEDEEEAATGADRRVDLEYP